MPEKTKNYLKLIDRIFNALGLPLVRRYITFESFSQVGSAMICLSKLGYKRINLSIENIDYLYLSSNLTINVGTSSINRDKYDDIEYKLRNMSVEDCLNLSDEEFELLIRLGGI